MCTLLVAAGVWPEVPLLVAANRDEHLDRPARGFSRGQAGSIPILAPRDLAAGGTWMGLNGAGLFVGITNRFGGPSDASRRSRGLLVLDALAHADADTAARALAGLSPAAHNPFHLVLADRRAAHLLWSDGAALRRQSLEPGFHVITERSLGAAPTLRPSRLHAALAGLGRAAYPGTEWFQTLLSVRDANAPMEGTFVTAPGMAYGTRSSTVLELGPGRVRLFEREGAVETAWIDHSAAAERLLAGTEPPGGPAAG